MADLKEEMNMALGDFDPLTHSPEARQALSDEILFAHNQNGTLRQRDWWTIAKNASHYKRIDCNGTLQFIIDTDIQTRHVSILCAPNSHLDPCEISIILRAAPVDGSTILAAYMYALSDILEHHYSKACKIENFHPFIRNGQTDWGLFILGEKPDEYLFLLSDLWRNTEQKFVFDAGRLQILYAALEADLEENNLKPDWFIPSAAFLPFAGQEPETNIVIQDFEVFELPEHALDLWLLAPDQPKKKTFLLNKLTQVFGRA